MRPVLASIAVACALVVPRAARADFDFQLAAGMNTRWLRQTPTLDTPALTTSARELTAGSVPMRGGVGMLGGYVDVGLTLDDRYLIPLLGGSLYSALGSYDAIITSRDGSIVRARPWTASSFEILLPGLGYRLKKRRWMFGVQVRGGYGVLAMEGAMASGADLDPIELSQTTFFVSAELEGCRRLDPTFRVCLQVAPRVYDFGFMNGGTIGLRLEWGR